MDYEKECDFLVIVDMIKSLLEREGITPPAFELKSSPDYDGVAVTFIHQFPAMQAPVQYRIQYNCSYIYGIDCFFAASIGFPKTEGCLTGLDCKRIASEFSNYPENMVSFEEYHTGKRIGAFHVIYSVNGKHVMDINELQQYLYRVRCTVAEIARSYFMKSAEYYISGKTGNSETIAKFKQINSIFEDDRVIISRDIFEDELGYDPADPINLEDTVDYTELFTGSSKFQDEIKQSRNIDNR